jgi:predicted DNA binding CopG/RHH family protein
MKRRQIYLTESEITAIKSFAFELGISISEYIRRIIDEHLAKRKVSIGLICTPI